MPQTVNPQTVIPQTMTTQTTHDTHAQTLRDAVLDRAPFLVACLMLALIVSLYATRQTGVFTLEELSLNTTAAMTLMLAATGQTIVLLRGGIDLSIGGMISLGTVIAATRFGDDAGSIVLWCGLILLLGLAVGVINGLLIASLRLQPFLVTLATWSILDGIAMIILPTDGGTVPGWWLGVGYQQFLGLSIPVWMLIVLLLYWRWFMTTRTGITIRAAGSSEKSAFLSGVSLTRNIAVTYGLSGLFAAAAALYLTTQTGAGSPTIGRDYILLSVAAAVIGGVSLFGGRGHLAGTVIGAYILTLISNLVFVLRVSSYWQLAVSGVVLLVAVLASALAEKTAGRRAA